MREQHLRLIAKRTNPRVSKATSPLEQNRLRFVSFRFWRLSRKWLTINATTYIFLERSFRDLCKKVWVVALILNRFRDKRKKKTERNGDVAYLNLVFT